jgi:NADH-quinone oxidoreductase subunit G
MGEQRQIKLTIDGRETVVGPGTLVIDAAKRMGIEVPSFCYYPGLTLQAACRMCLVEVEKAPKLQTACTLVAVDGMVVRTDSEPVHQARKDMLEFLLTNHPLDCPVCDKGGECELQDMTFRYGADTSRFVEIKIHQPEEKWSPAVYFDAPRCILCFRCVRVCDEGMDVKALGVGSRGVYSVIIPNAGDKLDCEECGMCIDICPVGALTSGTYRYRTRPWEMKYVGTPCTHCSNGCKTTLSVRNNEVIRGNNRDLSGINKEFLCAKGRFGFDYLNHADRLRLPLVRSNGGLHPASWEQTMRTAAERLKAVHEKHGPGAVGFIGSNRTSNEENYLLARLARATLGTNNLDHHRTADYAGLAAALGAAAGQARLPMEALAQAKAILLVGNDPTVQNPLVAWQIRTAVRLAGARLYIINSAEIKLRRQARQFVRVTAGEEAAAVCYLATGKDAPTGEAKAALDELKKVLGGESDVAIVFGAELAGRAIADLVAFGSSLPGTARYMPLGDYVNSRGAAEMGLLPGYLPGYAPVADAAARQKWEKLWGAPLAAQPGLDARRMLEAAAAGRLKALYVVGANPVKTFGLAKDALAGLELLVVQELFPTETTAHADVVLPALSAYEKDGTVTNTAGDIQMLRKALDTMGPRTDFDILRILSHQMAQLGLGKPVAARTPEAVFEEIRQNVPGYQMSLAALLAGGAEATAAAMPAGPAAAGYDVPAGAIFSSRDTLFTSGTLGRYLGKIRSLPEAKAQ